jgi:hypothetical protein
MTLCKFRPDRGCIPIFIVNWITHPAPTCNSPSNGAGSRDGAQRPTPAILSFRFSPPVVLLAPVVGKLPFSR